MATSAELIVEALAIVGTGAVVISPIPNKIKRILFLIFLVCTVIVLYKDMENVITGDEKEFFEHSLSRNTIDAMKEYNQKYPKGKYVEEANKKITALAEEATKEAEKILSVGGTGSLNLACRGFKVGADNDIERAKEYFSKCEE